MMRARRQQTFGPLFTRTPRRPCDVLMTHNIRSVYKLLLQRQKARLFVRAATLQLIRAPRSIYVRQAPSLLAARSREESCRVIGVSAFALSAH